MIPQIHKITAGIFIALICGLSPLSNGSPRISSVDGDIKEGGTVTITGAGFSTLNLEQVLYDHVSNQDTYNSLASGSSVPVNDGPWSDGTNVYGNQLTIVRDGDFRTSHSSAAYYGEVKSYIGWPRVLSNAGNQKLYASWWFKPSQLVNNGGSNKFIRVWDRSDGTATRISLTQMHMTYSGTSGNSHTSWSTTQPEVNRWNRFEIYIDSGSNSITATLNGNLVQNVKDFQKSSTSEGLTVAQIGFDPSEGSRYSNYSFRMNDIYVSSSPARVELSTSDVWDPTSKREILTPTSWSDGKITVNLNYFSHDPSDTLYLYVVDGSGTPTKTGIPLCEKCPGRPESVRVE